MCAKIIKGSTFVIIKLSYTKQSNQLWIVNMSYLLQPVCPSPHSSDTQQSYQHINISSTCHIILYFILFVDVPLNLISKMFFLSFASLSIILNKSDLSRMPLFYLSFHFLFFFFFFCLCFTEHSFAVHGGGRCFCTHIADLRVHILRRLCHSWGRHPLFLLSPIAKPHSNHLFLQLQVVRQGGDLLRRGFGAF